MINSTARITDRRRNRPIKTPLINHTLSGAQVPVKVRRIRARGHACAREPACYSFSARNYAFLLTKHSWHWWALRAIVGASILIVLVTSAISGLRVRRWTWDITTPARFTADMQRNFLYGKCT